MVRTHLISSDDLEFVWSMLFYAAHADDQPGATISSIRHDPDLSRYLGDWGRSGDLGFVAVEGTSPVGAAWLRLFTGDESHLATFVASNVPELAMAVVPDRVGQGLGSILLDRLVSEADRRGVPAIVLSARADNSAVRLYERTGFVEIDRIVNRVGTVSVKMARTRQAVNDHSRVEGSDSRTR
jgi:ribosomal protein S18 acetylase RimI-like enzyme